MILFRSRYLADHFESYYSFGCSLAGIAEEASTSTQTTTDGGQDGGEERLVSERKRERGRERVKEKHYSIPGTTTLAWAMTTASQEVSAK